MYQIIKRNGQTVDFDLAKITAAIQKAFTAQIYAVNNDTLVDLSLQVVDDFVPKIKENSISVEEIQDSVEAVLIRAGYESVAKAYILYRKRHENIRNADANLLDYNGQHRQT